MQLSDYEGAFLNQQQRRNKQVYKGVLVKYRHKKLCYGVAYLVSKALMPVHMHVDPIMHLGCAV